MLESPNDVSSPDRLKSDRAVFDRVRSKYAGAPRRDDSITPSQQVDAGSQPESAHPTPTNVEAATPADPAETPAKSQEPTPARKAAEEFLRLKTGSPASVFADMADEDVQSWAEERRLREANVDGVFSRAANAERDLEALRTKAATPAEPPGPTAAEQLAEANATLAKEDSLTDEGRAALDKLILLRLKPLQDQIDQHQESAKAEQSKRTVRCVDRSRDELAKRFGQLADDKTFRTVLSDMERLEDSPRFGGSGRSIEEWMPELMAAAAAVNGLEDHGGNEVSAARLAAEEELQERAAGSVETGGRNAQPTPPTKAGEDRRIYDAIRKHHRKKQWAVG